MPSTKRTGSPQKARPQTMYGYPSATSPTKTNLGLPTPQARPGHVRKGSINDMVSKFEGLNPPAESTTKPKPLAKPKPAVSTKPAQLKKPTLDTVRAEGLQQPILPTSATPSARASLPPKPQKPQGLGGRISNGAGTTSAGRSHGEAPKPDGYSRSSSGRSFPIVKPKPTIIASPSASSSIAPASPIKSGGSSPDKQQSVNALVARWNQGEMARKPVVKPKPVL
jgi:AP2-associated kinase